jgi:hypothetical protein
MDGNKVKMPITLNIILPGQEHARVKAYYHRKGRMKAKYNHIDLPEDAIPSILSRLAFKRGLKLKCENETQKCIKLVEQVLELAIKLCIEEKDLMLTCEKPMVYLMKTRRRMIYLSNIKILKKNSRNKTQ